MARWGGREVENMIMGSLRFIDYHQSLPRKVTSPKSISVLGPEQSLVRFGCLELRNPTRDRIHRCCKFDSRMRIFVTILLDLHGQL
jgi:hypothetical protein